MQGIDPKKLAFDIDGVIADTISLFIDIARKEYAIESVKYEDISSYAVDSLDGLDPEMVLEIFTRIVDGDFTLPLKPFPGAAHSLSRLHRQTGALLLVTARPKKEAIRDWIKNEIPVPIDKIDVLKAFGITHFVEDRLETGFILNDAGITPIIFNQPWNRKSHPFITVNGWEDLEKIIAFQ